jgi:hypothetical protein
MRWITLVTILGATTACSGGQTEAEPVSAKVPHQLFSCPMHPNETSAVAAKCSKCGMDMVETKAHDHASHDH